MCSSSSTALPVQTKKINVMFLDMRRANEINDPAPAEKRQVVLGNYFKLSNGNSLPSPVSSLHKLECPYCSVVLSSQHKAALPGNLKNHCNAKHTLEVAEAISRASGFESFARRSIFDDFEPLPSIIEENEAESEVEPSAANKAVVKRFSYSLKFKRHLLRKYNECEVLRKERLGPGQALFAVDVLTLTSECTGVPVSTIKDWIAARKEIMDRFEAHKLKRKLKRDGSGRKALFPAAEKIVAGLVRERRSECRLVSRQFVLKKLKEEAEKENPIEFRKCKWYFPFELLRVFHS